MWRRLLIRRERQALHRLRREVGGHQRAMRAALVLLERCLEEVVSRPELSENLPARVSGALLMRLGQDVRCASLLGQLGYPAQAGGAAAGAFESTFTLAYVGVDEERAKAWLEHDEPRRGFRQVKALIDDVTSDEDTAHLQYQTYRQLCLAKHGNPLLATELTYQRERGRTIAAIGPNATESAVRAIQFALEHCIGLVTLALRSIVGSHLDGRLGNLEPRLLALEESWQDLHEAAIARWGTEDPFPGKWWSLHATGSA